MKGDPGPYMNDDGDVWVPRTVPWREARRVALVGPTYLEWGQRVRYVGKTSAMLVGFARDCLCLEECERAYDDEGDEVDSTCRVPAWHFRIEERA